LYEAAIRRLEIYHPEPDAEDVTVDDVDLAGNSGGARRLVDVAAWRFPALRTLSFYQCDCLPSTTDGSEADVLLALLERCGPRLSRVTLSCTSPHIRRPACMQEDRDVGADADTAANATMPLAVLRHLALRRPKLVRLDAWLLLRYRTALGVDEAADAAAAANNADDGDVAVARPFPALRSLEVIVRWGSTLRPLMAMLAPTATTPTTTGTNTLRPPTLTTLHVNMQCASGPFLHRLAPLAPSLRDLNLIIHVLPGAAGLLQAREVRALSRLTALRFLGLWTQTRRDGRAGGCDADPDDDEGAGVADWQANLAPAGDAELLELVAALPQLEELVFEADSAVTRALFAQMGLRRPQLRRLTMWAPLDLGTLKPRGRVAFPALERLAMRSARPGSWFIQYVTT
jgi:hypothetical protein